MNIFNSNKHILVIGDVFLDRYTFGSVDRISPEAPIPILLHNQTEDRLGGAGNVAANIAAYGQQVTLISFVQSQTPEEARIQLLCLEASITFINLWDWMRTKGGNIEHAKEFIGAPIVKHRFMDYNGHQLLRVDTEEVSLEKLKRDRYMNPFLNILLESKGERCSPIDWNLFALRGEHMLSFDAIVLSDYGKGTLYHSRELNKALRESSLLKPTNPRVPIFGDIKYNSLPPELEHFTVLTPNQKEFENWLEVNKHFTQGLRDADSFETLSYDQSVTDWVVRRGAYYVAKHPAIEYPNLLHLVATHLNLEVLVVKLGAEGMIVWNRNSSTSQTVTHYPADAKAVYDVTGAGDTVIATLAAGAASGLSLRGHKLYETAVRAAGIAVGKIGTSVVRREELFPEREGEKLSLSPILDSKHDSRAWNLEVALIPESAKVVFTNGCFDMLHPSHVQFLRQARKLGDILIVAVNDGASYMRLRGKRATFTTAERLDMLRSLDMVDIALPFTGENLESIIRYIHPDVLVKGRPYEAEETNPISPAYIRGSDIVKGYGGEVHSIASQGDYSSTAIKESI